LTVRRSSRGILEGPFQSERKKRPPARFANLAGGQWLRARQLDNHELSAGEGIILTPRAHESGRQVGQEPERL
jgi:hypothetical protein